MNQAGFTKAIFLMSNLIDDEFKLFYSTIICIFSDVNSFILQGSDISLHFDKPNMEPDLKQI